MKLLQATGIVLISALFLVTIGLAGEVADVNTTDEQSWAGTWTDVNYSLSIEQNGSEISGIGYSFDIELNDPFILSGTIHEDGTSLIGTMKDSGTLIMYLSDDQMSFSADGTIDVFDNTSEAYTYTTEAVRNGTTIIPDSVWSGNWLTGNSSIDIKQSGNSVTGEYYPFESPGEGGMFEGTVSEDGKTLSTVWSFRCHLYPVR